MRVVLSVFAALAFVAAVGQAEPLNVKNIAADSKWVVHVDVDAIRQSLIVKRMFETCPVLKSEAPKHFDKIAEKVGIDLRKDLHGITLYGPDADHAHGTVVVFVKANKKPLVDMVAKAPDHKLIRRGGQEIHTWTAKHGPKAMPVAGAFYKDSAIVFSATPEGVAKAIGILGGKGGLEGRNPLAGRNYPGTTFVARSVVMPEKTRCPVLKRAESFRVAMGENEGKSFYRAQIVMKTAEAAEEIKKINEGFKALATLRFSGEADVMKLVTPFETTLQDKTLRITWSASTEDIWNLGVKMAKKAGEHMKKMGKGPATKGHPDAKKKTSASECPAGCQCPKCKAKATSTGSCPAGCQCPMCKAKAK